MPNILPQGIENLRFIKFMKLWKLCHISTPKILGQSIGDNDLDTFYSSDKSCDKWYCSNGNGCLCFGLESRSLSGLNQHGMSQLCEKRRVMVIRDWPGSSLTNPLWRSAAVVGPSVPGGFVWLSATLMATNDHRVLMVVCEDSRVCSKGVPSLDF